MKYVIIAISFTVALLLVKDNMNIVWQILSTIASILSPFLIGFLFAYILNFPYKFFYTKALGKIGAKREPLQKLKKPLSLVCTYLIVVALIVLIIEIVVPQIATNVINLIDNMPAYFKNATQYINEFFDLINVTFHTDFSLNDAMNQLFNEMTELLTFSNITSTAGGATQFIFDMLSNTTSSFRMQP